MAKLHSLQQRALDKLTELVPDEREMNYILMKNAVKIQKQEETTEGSVEPETSVGSQYKMKMPRIDQVSLEQGRLVRVSF